ncbi:hypothetical protein Tco_0074008 [Tanacetum coccineum]
MSSSFHLQAIRLHHINLFLISSFIIGEEVAIDNLAACRYDQRVVNGSISAVSPETTDWVLSESYVGTLGGVAGSLGCLFGLHAVFFLERLESHRAMCLGKVQSRLRLPLFSLQEKEAESLEGFTLLQQALVAVNSMGVTLDGSLEKFELLRIVGGSKIFT